MSNVKGACKIESEKRPACSNFFCLLLLDLTFGWPLGYVKCFVPCWFTLLCLLWTLCIDDLLIKVKRLAQSGFRSE